MTPKPQLKKLTKDATWPLKKQYYASEILWLQDFIKARGYKWDNYTKKLTEGWQSDKKQFLAKVQDKIEEQLVEQVAEERAISTDELKKMKHTTIQLLKAKLNEISFRTTERANYIKWKRDKDPKKKPREWYKPQEVRASEIIEIKNAVKLELWEPLNISKNFTTPTDDNLSDGELEIIEMLDEVDALVLPEDIE